VSALDPQNINSIAKISGLLHHVPIFTSSWWILPIYLHPHMMWIHLGDTSKEKICKNLLTVRFYDYV